MWLFVDFCTSRVPDGSSATSQETRSVQSVLERERRLATPHDDGDEHLREVLGELQDAATDLSEVILLGVGRGAQRRSPTPAMQPEVPPLELPVFSIRKVFSTPRRIMGTLKSCTSRNAGGGTFNERLRRVERLTSGDALGGREASHRHCGTGLPHRATPPGPRNFTLSGAC